MISVEHMDELITRFKSGELDIRDIIEQSYFGGRADAIDEFVELINTMPTYKNENGEIMPMPVEMIAEQLKGEENGKITERNNG